MPAQKKAKVEKENGERWLLTYSDLITLLLIFFIILYSISSTNVKKFEDLTGALQQAFNNGNFQVIVPTTKPGSNNGPLGTNPAQEKVISKLKKQFLLLSKQLGISPQALSVGQNKDGIVITLAGGLLFYPGGTQLRPPSPVLLAHIADIIRKMPNKIRVRAYTDDVISPDSLYDNWALSSLRAVSIVQEFSTNDGIAPVRLDAEGYGQYHPLTKQTTAEAQARNRRAEIIIVYSS